MIVCEKFGFLNKIKIVTFLYMFQIENLNFQQLRPLPSQLADTILVCLFCEGLFLEVRSSAADCISVCLRINICFRFMFNSLSFSHQRV